MSFLDRLLGNNREGATKVRDSGYNKQLFQGKQYDPNLFGNFNEAKRTLPSGQQYDTVTTKSGAGSSLRGIMTPLTNEFYRQGMQGGGSQPKGGGVQSPPATQPNPDDIANLTNMINQSLQGSQVPGDLGMRSDLILTGNPANDIDRVYSTLETQEMGMNDLISLRRDIAKARAQAESGESVDWMSDEQLARMTPQERNMVMSSKTLPYDQMLSDVDAQIENQNEMRKLQLQYGEKGLDPKEIQANIKGYDDTITKIDNILEFNMDGLENSVGARAYNVRRGMGKKRREDKEDFLNLMKNITAVQSLDTFAEAKARGITFGATNQAELDMIKNAVGVFANYTPILDKNGDLLGYRGSPDSMVRDLQQFKEDIQEIKQASLQSLQGAGGQYTSAGTASQQQGGGATQDYIFPEDAGSIAGRRRSEVVGMAQRAYEQGEMDQETLNAIYEDISLYDEQMGFNTVGGDTNSAQSVANAIMQVESGGRQVAGASGEFGSFQFLPATWKTVSQEMAGQVLPQTPENEYNVALAKIDQLLQRGYSPKEVALIWNTSLGGSEQPLIRQGVNKHGVNYDSLAYANKVMNQLTA